MIHPPGAYYLGQGKCEFTVWAPLLDQLSLHILPNPSWIIPLQRDSYGYFHLAIDNIAPGTKYLYQFKGVERPDPASFCQPDDVMGPSAVIDHADFKWPDKKWRGIPPEEMIIYELHIGTFTPQGTFESAIHALDHLCDLGINAVEVMPVAQFPGERNWGYDGVYPFAVQHSYGGPRGFKTFVAACHQKGLAVILDVVYNHLGPEGNFLGEYMPVFTDKYRTPWGNAINYDDAYSHGVRNFFIENALYWFRCYHVDALRLDAVHSIYDFGAKHFLKELSEAVAELARQKKKKLYLIAESDLNDTRVILPEQKGGYNISAQWNDDYHHALHTLLTKEESGYYEDFGQLSHFVKALKEGFVYAWDYSVYRKRYHGSSSKDIPPQKFIVCSQNHDQVGNRAGGERSSVLMPFEALKLAAGAIILSPYIPLIFMGEEYGEKAPFLYFVSFHDEQLIQAVREGRAKEFASSGAKQDVPAPDALETFQRSKLNWQSLHETEHKILMDFYKALISARKSTQAFKKINKEAVAIEVFGEEALLVRYRHEKKSVCIGMNFSAQPFSFMFEAESKIWGKIISSSDSVWAGPGGGLPEVVKETQALDLNPLSCFVCEEIAK